MQEGNEGAGVRNSVRRWQEAGALVLYAVLSLLTTWPMPLKFGTEALGGHYFDRIQNIWNLWWVKTALLDLHVNPFHTNLLLYPQGADLYFHTLNLPSTLMSLPVQLLAGPVAAYNFSMMLAIMLYAYAEYRLARYLTGSFPGALIAGIIYGFSPIALFQLEGHTNLVSMQWMALCIEFYLRAWNSEPDGLSRGRRRRDAILMGLFFALALLTIGYYEVQLLLFFVAHIIWWLAKNSGVGAWKARVSDLLRHARPALTWGLGTAVVVSAPYVIGAWVSLNSGQVIPQTADDSARAVADSADLLSFIVPNRDHWLLGKQMPWWNGVSPDIHDLATLYELAPPEGEPGAYMQLGDGWHAPEQSYGKPFRWVDGNMAEICMAQGGARSAPLQLEVTSFAASRHLQLWPKHCSWLNQIEIWFGILVRRLLKRGSFVSVEELGTRIMEFIEYFNRTMAKAFKWTYTGRPLAA